MTTPYTLLYALVNKEKTDVNFDLPQDTAGIHSRQVLEPHGQISQLTMVTTLAANCFLYTYLSNQGRIQTVVVVQNNATT